MQKIATDIQTFERLRQEGFTYVDKTEILWRMANGFRGSQFFIARPRRFGKTLAVTTLRALFEGKREVFKGLAIDSLEWDWTPLPVLHITMNDAQRRSVDELNSAWRSILRDEAVRNGIKLREDVAAPETFKNLINDLAAKSPTGQMVLLVDEYDKPLLGHLEKPDVNDFRDALKAFYSVIKSTEEKQRFMFMTGVSRFSKVSVFSDLNNLNDQQKRHMDEYETMLAADPVGEAQAKARRIINDAIAQSESMMQTAQETRDRVMTAARTTYYDALQFKMDLVEHFNTLERSIDASIGVIGKVEIPKLPETPIPHIDVDPKDD